MAAILTDRVAIDAKEDRGSGRWYCIQLARLEEFTEWTHEGGQDYWTDWVHEEATVELPSGQTPSAYAAQHFPEWSMTNAFPTFKPVPLPEGIYVPF